MKYEELIDEYMNDKFEINVSDKHAVEEIFFKAKGNAFEVGFMSGFYLASEHWNKEIETLKTQIEKMKCYMNCNKHNIGCGFYETDISCPCQNWELKE